MPHPSAPPRDPLSNCARPRRTPPDRPERTPEQRTPLTCSPHDAAAGEYPATRSDPALTVQTGSGRCGGPADALLLRIRARLPVPACTPIARRPGPHSARHSRGRRPDRWQPRFRTPPSTSSADQRAERPVKERGAAPIGGNGRRHSNAGLGGITGVASRVCARIFRVYS